MRRAQIRRYLGWIGAIALSLAVAGPASPAAALPTITVSDTTDLVTGDIIRVEVDGASGYDGAYFLTVRSCGNARANGQPLEAATVRDCRRDDSRVSTVVNPIDGVDYVLEHRWVNTEIGDNEAQCVENGLIECVVVVELIRSPQGTLYHEEIPVNGPADPPTIDIDSFTVVEGTGDDTAVRIPVRLSRPSTQRVAVEVYLEQGTAGWADFRPQNYAVDFEPGSTLEYVTATIIGDDLAEGDEEFRVRISSNSGGAIGFAGVVTIVDDEPVPRIVPGWSYVAEGDDGTTFAQIPVRLTGRSQHVVSAAWQTYSSTATQGTDFLEAQGTITFQPSDPLEQFVQIPIVGDDDVEPDELAIFVTSDWENALPGGYWGLGGVAIGDDDEDCTPRLGPGADLRFCDFSGATLADIDLSGADLRDTRFNAAILTGVDFSEAQLDRADFSDATVDTTDFANATAPEIRLDGATVTNSPMDGLDAPGASIDNALILQGSAIEANFAGSTIRSTTFGIGDASQTDLPDITWGNDSICPDGSSSAIASTCWKVPVDFGPLSGEGDTISLGDEAFGATFFAHREYDAEPGPSFFPGYGAAFGVPPYPGFSLSGPVHRFDRDGDGRLDANYQFPVISSPLELGTREYCASMNSTRGYVYGCSVLTVTEGPPLSPPMSPTMSPTASPPASPTASPPISGGPLSGLGPFLRGPYGLMATASGVGLIFLAGSSRVRTEIEGTRREDDLDADD